MRLIKSKEEKEMEFKMKMRSLEQAMGKYIKTLEKTKENLIKDAKSSKVEGLSSQYNNAVKALKLAHAQQVKAKAMLSDFRITMQIRDMNAMTGKFLEAMGSASREMNGLMKNMEFSKVQNEFNAAMANSENTSDMLSTFLEGFGDIFENINDDATGVSDDEILKMIDNSIAMDESERDKTLEAELDKQIEAKLRQIEPGIKA